MIQKISKTKKSESEIEKADFDHFYAQYSAKVFGCILQWVDDKNAAEQILILTFCKLWKARNSFAGKEMTKDLFYVPFIIQAGKDFYDERNITYNFQNNGNFRMKFVDTTVKEKETII